MKKVTKKDLKGQIADFPIEVVQWMCEQQVLQGNEFDPSVFEKYAHGSACVGGFDWGESILNQPLCNDIIANKNFHLFFKYFNTKPSTPHRTFESGSIRDDDSNKPLVNHLTAYTRLRFGHLLRQGANKYGKDNWRKGQPDEAALESLHRHLAKYELGDRDEDHLASMLFNVQLLLENEKNKDVPHDFYVKK